jgi:hypothetical protein
MLYLAERYTFTCFSQLLSVTKFIFINSKLVLRETALSSTNKPKELFQFGVSWPLGNSKIATKTTGT